MRSASLEVFAKAVQTTDNWLTEIILALELGDQDRQLAWQLLTAVLQALRDQLTPALAGELGDQLPVLMRGAYYEGYAPPLHSEADRSAKTFLERVDNKLPVLPAGDLLKAVGITCSVVAGHIDGPTAEAIWKVLPEAVTSPAASSAGRARPVHVAPGDADRLWRQIIEDGRFGEGHPQTGKDHGQPAGLKKARPH